jgi:hypothetical protein
MKKAHNKLLMPTLGTMRYSFYQCGRRGIEKR